MRQVKIFISSPSDVRPERLQAQRIIERLAREFAFHLDIKPILWEREPLLASEHFQENIPAPRESDIVVVILWSRLGVPLPSDKYLGPLSGTPVTGTEWEFEDALASYRERHLPDLLFYRKEAEVTSGLSDRQKLDERLAQLEKVEGFVQRWFLAADGASFTAAVHSFADTADFEERLDTHLRELLKKRVDAEDDEERQDVRWHQAPFRGLLSFEYEHAPVFFGRARARSDLRLMLAKRAAAGTAFLLVMGASGSGKSSLVKAGLLPDLALPGMIERVGLCRFALFRPTDADGDPIRALATALLAESALPELKRLHHDVESLTGLLRSAPDQAGMVVRQGLAEAASAAKLTERAEARIAVVVDQLEELFTLATLSDADRETFVDALKALAHSGGAFVLATMRSDFFDRLEALPALARLSEDEGRYLLLPPTDAEVAQMIGQPAREAGLSFEAGADGIALNDIICEAATKDRSSLPMLSFLLDQLWQRRDEDGRLTFAAYEELGGLEGALGRRAEEVFSKLPPEVQAALPSVLRALVTVGTGPGRGATARSVPMSAFAEGSDRRKLVDALLAPEARLLSAEAEGGEARVRVAHEALLTHWPRAREEIADDMADVRLRTRLETAAEAWSAAAARDRRSHLLRPGKPLTEAEDLLRRHPEDLSPQVTAFIRQSVIANRNAWRFRIGAGLATAAALAAIAVFGSYQLGDWLQYREERALEASRTDIRGTLLAFSVEEGKIAYDSIPGAAEAHSPYLSALLSLLGDRTLDLNTLFAKVNQKVVDLTSSSGLEQQIPELSTTLNGKVFLLDPPPNRQTFILSVGAADYEHLAKLVTAKKDAEAFAEAFDGLGYNVQLVSDPTREAFVAAVTGFADLIEASAASHEPQSTASRDGVEHRGLAIDKPVIAGPNTLAILYLAGNGVTVDGVDYFVPIDADASEVHSGEEFYDKLRPQLVRIDDIIAELKRVAAIQVVIVDTCRDNPFAPAETATR